MRMLPLSISRLKMRFLPWMGFIDDQKFPAWRRFLPRRDQNLFSINEWFDTFDIQLEPTRSEKFLEGLFVCLSCLTKFRRVRSVRLQVLPPFEDSPEFLFRWLNVFEHSPQQCRILFVASCYPTRALLGAVYESFR
jgi:hypothetical protein